MKAFSPLAYASIRWGSLYFLIALNYSCERNIGNSEKSEPPQTKIEVTKLPTLNSVPVVQKSLPIGFQPEQQLSGDEHDLFSYAKAMLDKDESAAIDWLLGLPKDATSIAAFGAAGIWFGINAKDRISDLAARIHTPGLKSQFLACACRELSKFDARYAWKLSVQHASDFAKGVNIQGDIIQSAMTQSVDTATELYEQVDHEKSPEICLSYFRSLASADTELAKAFFLDPTNVNAASKALPDIIAGWPQDNIVEASVILRDFPAGHSKDLGIEKLINRIQLKYPDDAAKWADSISDPLLKNKMFEQIAVVTSNFDPEAAKQVVTNSKTLSDADKLIVLKRARIK
jgi:hypothetical protein